MPIYTMRCTAGHTFEAVSSYDKRDRVTCERCGKPCTVLPSLFRQERRFAGSESVSLTEGCHPRDVQAQRQLYGDTVHIDDRGDFSFESRGQQRRFMKKKREAERLTGAVTRAKRQ